MENTTVCGRVTVDSTLLAMTSLNEAPRDLTVRGHFVAAALSFFAARRGFTRLSRVIASMPLYPTAGRDADLGSFLRMLDNWEASYRCEWQAARVGENDSEYMLREIYASGCLHDAEFLRLATIAEDVYSWDSPENTEYYESEFRCYVTPGWPVLCDEVEFEQELAA